ncbi:hypothetical protein [Pontibacillus marinus]|uniref:Uncharacterized protein n=1 Tax=Pontibacillus marinus BH030004 = DSM 16465 TaxID=1385511 RepID=A0A0A5G0B4_9BACI|nr:hypothetical protein [Pontibacillus marinus]KGX84523.1 hypothetical protein N783_17295 [Pontibacillus marinus BH030004 = DSM 16465]
MNASYLEIGAYNEKQPLIVNLTGVSIKLSNDVSLPFGEYQHVNQVEFSIEGKSFSLQSGLNIFFRTGGAVEQYVMSFEEQPPKEEAFLHTLHLDVSKPLITIKARYGDEVTKRLPYKGKSEPILLYAPMDLPLDFYHFNGTLFQSLEGYVTKEHSHIIFVLIEHITKPLWGIELNY